MAKPHYFASLRKMSNAPAHSSCTSSSLILGSDPRRDLPHTFVPGDHDVICGKGKGCFNHEGNKKFRRSAKFFLERYSNAKSKAQKSVIVSAIIDTVRSQAGEGGFVKKDASTGHWYEVGDLLAREKVGQTLRDSLHTHYKSSSKAKKARRLVEQAKASSDLTEISNKNMEISSKIDNLKDGVTLTANEAQMMNLFTQANLDILNELNRLNDLPL